MRKLILGVTAAVALGAAVTVVPASAQEVGVGIGPYGPGVTIGAGRDWDRDHYYGDRVVRDRRGPRERDVIIRRDRDYDHRYDRDRRGVVIEDND